MQDSELITEILLRRRIELGISMAPINVGEAPADVVFVVKKSTDSTDYVRVLAHSKVLKKGCDYFRELLTYQHNNGLLNYLEERGNIEVKEITVNCNPQTDNISEIRSPDLDGNDVKGSIPRRASLITKPETGSVEAGKTIPRKSKSVCFSDRLEIMNIGQLSVEDRESLVKEDKEATGSSSENGIEGNGEKEGTDEERRSLNLVDLGQEIRERNSCVGSTDFISPVESGNIDTIYETLLEAPFEEMENSEKSDVNLPNTESPRSAENDLEEKADVNEIDEGCKRTEGVCNPGSNEENCGESNKTVESCSCSVDEVEIPSTMAAPPKEAWPCEFVEETNQENGFVLRKAEWTESVLYGLLEWIYTGSCHVDCDDLPALYVVADRVVLTTLTWCIKKHNPIEYMRLALNNENHRKALLKLSAVADCPELTPLRSMCQSLSSYESRYKSFPRSFVFKSAYIHNRENEFIEEGFHTVGGCRFCILKEPNRSKQYPSDVFLREFPEHVALLKRGLKLSATATRKHIHYGKPSPQQETSHVIVFEEDIPRTCFEFFNYAVLCSFKSILRQDGHAQQRIRPEVFKLRMVTRFKMGSVLEKAIGKAIPVDLFVKEVRGAGYIKCPSHCNSISIVGDPMKILVAAKAIPQDMVGSSALKIRSPSLRTFCSLFCTSNSMGFDLVKKSIYFIKPLETLIEILEFVTKLNEDAFEPMDTKRTIIELVEPTDPF